MTPFFQMYRKHFADHDRREFERYHSHPQHQRQFTEPELDNARACGCQSCREYYGLPDPAPAPAGHTMLAGLVIGLAAAYAGYKMFVEPPTDEEEHDRPPVA